VSAATHTTTTCYALRRDAAHCLSRSGASNDSLSLGPHRTPARCAGVAGFGVAAQATEYCRDLDAAAVVVLHQADIGEYLRVEDDGLL
jgi:hypothetical protein